MVKSIWLLNIAFLYSTIIYGQQNVPFTQYVFNSLGVNPAYAGYKEGWFGHITLRSQWAAWGDASPKATQFSVDGLIDEREKRHGVGFQVNSFHIGVQSAVSTYANYALRLQLDDYGEQQLSLGLAAGVTRYGLDGTKLNATDSKVLDQTIPNGMINTWRPDMRLGIHYSDPKWYAGVSVSDLFAGVNNEENFQFAQSSMESVNRRAQLYLAGGALFSLESGLLFRPSFLMKDDFKGPTTLDATAILIFNDVFWIGGSFRTRSRIFNRAYSEYAASQLSSQQVLGAITQFYLGSKFRIGYSYDHMLNRLGSLQYGSHEITFGAFLSKKKYSKLNRNRYF